MRRTRQAGQKCSIYVSSYVKGSAGTENLSNTVLFLLPVAHRTSEVTIIELLESLQQERESSGGMPASAPTDCLLGACKRDHQCILALVDEETLTFKVTLAWRRDHCQLPQRWSDGVV